MTGTEDMSLVTCCGGCCGGCAIGNGEVRNRAKALQGMVNAWCCAERARAQAEHVPAARHYPEFLAVLEWLTTQDCQGCHAGGCTLWGDSDCAVRDCVLERGFAGCWECAEESSCGKLSSLDQGDPRMPSNRRRIREVGPATWAAEESARLRQARR